MSVSGESKLSQTLLTDDLLRSCFSDATKLKPNTIRPYLANLVTIQKYANGSPLIDILDDAEKWYPVLEKASYDGRRVKTKNGKTTLRTLVKTIMALFKYADLKVNKAPAFEAWSQRFVALSTIIQDQADINLPTASTMTWSSISEKLKGLKLGSIEHVTLSLYVLIPPRRQQDYWKLALTPLTPSVSDSTGHIDLLVKKTITVTVYKTVDIYDVWTKELPPALILSIESYLKARTAARQAQAAAARRKGVSFKGCSCKWLFCRRDGAPYASLSSFTDANNDVIKKALGNEHASVNTLRHAAASFVATSKEMLRKDKKQFALDMGHSMTMQSLYVIVEKDE